ncbi:MAG: HAD family hydrolase [Phycisphaerae bacterium]|nr:HAD family hydrolase [Phycisphaerae bacterium]
MQLPKDIKAILFDVDGTLYDQKPLHRQMLVQLAWWACRHPWRTPRLFRVIQAFRRAQEALRAGNEPLRAQGLYETQLAWAARSAGVASEVVKRIVEEWMFERPLGALRRQRQSDLPAILERLRQHGYRLGVYSDYPAEAKLDAMGIGHCFDVVVCSYDPDVGRFKPDPRGFVHTAECLGSTPDETLYVGDRVEVDAVGAGAAGMRAVILQDAPAEAEPGVQFVHTLDQLVECLDGLAV